MHIHDIKIKQHKINPNSNMWETNQAIKHVKQKLWKHKNMERGNIETYMWKQKQKQVNKN